MFFSLSSTIRIVAMFTSCLPRQNEREGRSRAGLAVEADAAAVQLDEAPRQRGPEAGAFVLVGVVAADLAEFLEHGLLVVPRDADAGVGHRDLEGVVDQPRP